MLSNVYCRSPAQVAIHKGGVYVATFPLHHAAGKIILATGLYVGATVVVRKQFDYHKFLDDNIRYSVGCWWYAA